MTAIFAKYGRRPGKKLDEPADDVTIVDFTMGRYGVLAVFIKPDGKLSADVIDAFSECRTSPRMMVPADAMVEGIEPGSIIWRERR